MKNQTSLQRDKLPNGTKQTLELIAFLSYEFKSQLASITSSVDMLVKESAHSHDDTETKLINNILASHRYLEARASELLNLVKLQVEGLHVEPELLDINAVVHRTIDRLLHIIHDRGQLLTINLMSIAPKIIADSLRIEQVFHHLLSQTSKSTPTGTSISVSTYKQAGYVVIEIQDNSPFIPQDEQRRLALPYYRLTGDRDTKISETGLGLALCKHLVGLHGGIIWVENNENKGNIIAFTLPLSNS